MEARTKREAIIEVINKLFVYTDQQLWDKLRREVFTPEVTFDMSSAGGPSKKLTAKEICDLWSEGFKGIDHVHHQAGNYIVQLSDEGEADVVCYAIAIHYKKASTKGNTREFVGSYNIHASFTDQGWRIDGFKYNLKYINGNTTLI